MDSQVAENATAIKRETGCFLGWTDANPKRQVNAVLLRSGKRLIPRALEINNTEKHDVVEETDESRSHPINLDDPSTESEIPRERGNPNTEEEAIKLEEEEGEIEDDAEIDRQERTSVDRQTTSDERRTKRRFDTNRPAHVCDRDLWPRQPEDGPIPLFENFPDTRKAAKSLECRNRAIEDTWDDYDSIFYNAWLQVSIELTRIQFRPDPRLVRVPVAQPHRYTVQRTAGPQPHQSEDTLPPFPPMPDMSTRAEGDFQRVVVDTLTAI
ncbi:hypothetical protein F2Q69_00029024 [Brassica cretica]|uniref:Uncharacterized protein n=1 Tax=Brassica cretica TaxID=69181 RepID=A0A8S9S2G3_BRACR|nr:hypothetical protein F2Q69_00029024 [Brassica cretica]